MVRQADIDEANKPENKQTLKGIKWERSCTDVICCLIFLLFLAGGAVSSAEASHGEPFPTWAPPAASSAASILLFSAPFSGSPWLDSVLPGLAKNAERSDCLFDLVLPFAASAPSRNGSLFIGAACPQQSALAVSSQDGYRKEEME